MIDQEVVIKREHYKGYEYMIAHNGHGYRCGYVKITRSHPWYLKHHDVINSIHGVSVHGKLTYSNYDKEMNWWIGFDCAHSVDAIDPSLPILEKIPRKLKILFSFCDDQELGKEYLNSLEKGIKDNEFVEKECKKLIDAAIKMEVVCS